MDNTKNGSLAAEAAAHLAENAGAMGRFNGIQHEIRKQADCLLKWAQEKGVYLADHYWNKLDKFDSPSREHCVYLDAANNRVIKCTKPGKFGEGHGSNGKFGNHCPATPYFYLQRLELTNQLFLTDLRFEGVALGEPEFGTEKIPIPFAVSTQLFIEAADAKAMHPSEKEIEGYMVKLGFCLLENCETNWIRKADGIVVTDTRVVNFINSDEGVIPIDLIVSKIDFSI